MLDEEAISLFRAEMKGVKPLKQDTFVAARPHKKKALATIKEQREQQDTLFYFSDEYEPLLDEESAVNFAWILVAIALKSDASAKDSPFTFLVSVPIVNVNRPFTTALKRSKSSDKVAPLNVFLVASMVAGSFCQRAIINCFARGL